MARKCVPTDISIANEPDWDGSIRVQDNLDPNTIIIDDMDLGCGTPKKPGTPTPSLEGYWDRDANIGTLYPKVLSDKVMVGKTAQSYDEEFGVLGKIYSTAGYMMGPGTQLIYASDSTTMGIYVQDRNSVFIRRGHLRGAQDNAPMINTLDATTSATTPAYTFYTDQNTGMYRPTANTLGFTVDGSPALILTSIGYLNIPTVPVTAADETVPVLARNASTGLVEQRVLTELHTHSNKAVLDLLTAPAGSLWYDGALVFDPSPYYTSIEVDALDAALLANIETRSLNTHNHNLADLTEHSYNSLVDLPDLSELHSHSNKSTLDRIPDYTTATQDDVMVRDGGGITWLPLSAVTSGHWLRDVVGDPFLYPAVTGDDIKIDATIFVDTIDEYITDNGILLGQCVTIDQLNSQVGINVPSPAYDLDVAGAGRFSDATAGQSRIGYGLIVNYNGSDLVIADFLVKAATYNAISVDASENSMLMMSNALGKVGFFGETPTVQSTGWTITNHVLDKVLDADVTTVDEICDVLGELITELKTKGILGG